jgi:hypothetical protein
MDEHDAADLLAGDRLGVIRLPLRAVIGVELHHLRELTEIRHAFLPEDKLSPYATDFSR